uniref:Uncharacterized protein n=1 Tax=Kalanchoe fedtschenkoi TaxID=63787 RepID=A0A7N0SXH4_KALFE
MDFDGAAPDQWSRELSSYADRLGSLDKPDLIPLDEFYRNELPALIHARSPNPHITAPELVELMKWKLARGKWRPRLLDFVSSLDGEAVVSASRKAFEALPDVSRAVTELTVLKGVGPATAVLAAYAPGVAPFMSDEAMVASLGNAKDYTLKQYVKFASKLQGKAKELSSHEKTFTPSDVERALWSAAIGAELSSPARDRDSSVKSSKSSKRKRK